MEAYTYTYTLKSRYRKIFLFSDFINSHLKKAQEKYIFLYRKVSHISIFSTKAIIHNIDVININFCTKKSHQLHENHTYTKIIVYDTIAYQHIRAKCCLCVRERRVKITKLL